MLHNSVKKSSEWTWSIFFQTCTSCPLPSSCNFCPSFKKNAAASTRAPTLLHFLSADWTSRGPIQWNQEGSPEWQVTWQSWEGSWMGFPLPEAASQHCCYPAKNSFRRNSSVPKSTEQKICFFSPRPAKSWRFLPLPSRGLRCTASLCMEFNEAKWIIFRKGWFSAESAPDSGFFAFCMYVPCFLLTEGREDRIMQAGQALIRQLQFRAIEAAV